MMKKNEDHHVPRKKDRKLEHRVHKQVYERSRLAASSLGRLNGGGREWVISLGEQRANAGPSFLMAQELFWWEVEGPQLFLSRHSRSRTSSSRLAKRKDFQERIVGR